MLSYDKVSADSPSYPPVGTLQRYSAVTHLEDVASPLSPSTVTHSLVSAADCHVLHVTAQVRALASESSLAYSATRTLEKAS
jgi:hypothetical protein